MSSENSTESPGRTDGKAPDALQPWQLFTLAGLIGATAVVAMSRGESAPGLILLSLTIFAAAAVGAAALRMLGPFAGLRIEAPVRVEGGHTRASLDRDKALALRAIKELEFDRAMGKVSDEDFVEVGGRLRSRAARILRQLDAGGGYGDRIEQDLRARLAAAGVTMGPPPAATVAPPPAPPRAESRLVVCAGCGTSNDVDARFCKHCGARVEQAS